MENKAEAAMFHVKVSKLLSKDFNKVTLSEELGISRPTLDKRLEKGNWKKLEVEKILKLCNGTD